MTNDPLATSVLFDVFALGQAVRRFLADFLAGGPLRPEDYAIYSAMFELESATPTALADRLGMPLTTVMDHLARLEALGHVRRSGDPNDGRATRVVLSAEGLAAHRTTNALFEAANAAFIAELRGGADAAKAALAEIRAAVERVPHGVAAPTLRSGGRGG